MAERMHDKLGSKRITDSSLLDLIEITSLRCAARIENLYRIGDLGLYLFIIICKRQCIFLIRKSCQHDCIEVFHCRSLLSFKDISTLHILSDKRNGSTVSPLHIEIDTVVQVRVMIQSGIYSILIRDYKFRTSCLIQFQSNDFSMIHKHNLLRSLTLDLHCQNNIIKTGCTTTDCHHSHGKHKNELFHINKLFPYILHLQSP